MRWWWVTFGMLMAGLGCAFARQPDDPVILHLVTRTSFGPRPGDLARVHDMGVAAYLEEQLHPERVRDAPAQEQLASLSGLRVPPASFAQDYYLPMIASRQNFTDTQ